MEDTFSLQIQGHELLMDMNVKSIACEGLKATFANSLQRLPSLSPEVAVTRLRKMIELMEKTTEQHSKNACISDTTGDHQADAADLGAAKQSLRRCTHMWDGSRVCTPSCPGTIGYWPIAYRPNAIPCG
jgi:hypothetical protein